MNATADRHAFFRSRPSATRRHTYTDQERPPRGGGAQPRKSGRCPALASRRTYLLHADTCGNPPYRPADAPLSKGLFALPLEINGETEGDKGRSALEPGHQHTGGNLTPPRAGHAERKPRLVVFSTRPVPPALSFCHATSRAQCGALCCRAQRRASYPRRGCCAEDHQVAEIRVRSRLLGAPHTPGAASTSD